MTIEERFQALGQLFRLHTLISENKDESQEAIQIRDTLESLIKTPSDKAMMQWMSEQLYQIKEFQDKKQKEAKRIIVNEELIHGLLTSVTEAIHTDPRYPSSMYGDDYENVIFKMHRFCWCDNEDCPYCSEDAPNFIHYKSGLKIWWYKYIGRSMRMEAPTQLSSRQILEIFNEVIKSIEEDHANEKNDSNNN